MGAVTRRLPTVPAGPIEITVRDRNGAYTTQTVAGRSASCTMSAAHAAERLADKLWGIGTATLVSQGEPGVSTWRIEPSSEVAR
jgi:hypothetical protein